jgi:hypothetical protein
MYLTINKYSIATNVIYSNNNYMFGLGGPSSGCVIGSYIGYTFVGIFRLGGTTSRLVS